MWKNTITQNDDGNRRQQLDLNTHMHTYIWLLHSYVCCCCCLSVFFLFRRRRFRCHCRCSWLCLALHICTENAYTLKRLILSCVNNRNLCVHVVEYGKNSFTDYFLAVVFFSSHFFLLWYKFQCISLTFVSETFFERF